MSSPTRSSRRKPIPKGTRADPPAWLTPEARAEIRSAAAEWNAGTPATGLAVSGLADLFRPANLGFPRPAREHEKSAVSIAAELLEMHHEQGRPVPQWLTEFHAAEVHLMHARLASRRRAPGAGRRPKCTQYDAWFERRRDLHRRLVRLPCLRLGSGRARADLIAEIARQLIREGVPRHGPSGLASRVRDRLQQLAADSVIRMLARPGITLTVPHRTTIERILKSSGL